MNDLHNYLHRCSELSKQKGSPQPLIDYLEEQLEQPLLPFCWAHFYKGERAFHATDYEEAIRHYLLAKEIPHYNFFCFRATAFLMHQLGRMERAREFAHKALSISPHDPLSQSLLNSLKPEEAPPPSIPIGDEEWKELNALF